MCLECADSLAIWNLSKSQRLVVGAILLLFVDVIWVASSELTAYIFHDANFNKPFFSTYVKTSMFMLYLLLYGVWKIFQSICSSGSDYSHLVAFVDDDNAEDSKFGDEVPLSEPVWVPLAGDESDKGSGSGGDIEENKPLPSVRFFSYAEVRHLSEDHASEALLARLSFQATNKIKDMARRSSYKLNIKDNANTAFYFCVLWFFGNYCYQLSLDFSMVSVVNVLSSTSGIFTLILTAIFPSSKLDKFTVTKLIVVLWSFFGVVFINIQEIQQQSIPSGAIFAVVGAMFYASYLVFLRRKVKNESELDVPLFFGFIGVFNTLIMWPGLIILNFLKIEEFDWPTRQQWLLIGLNGIFGTVISEILWLWGCLLTSSLIGTLSISLTIPLSICADILVNKKGVSMYTIGGAIPVFISFMGAVLVAHYNNWDPVGMCFGRMCSCCKVSDSNPSFLDDTEELESLINVGEVQDCEES